MKKMFPLYLLIISLLSVGCYNKPEQTSSGMIILKNAHETNLDHDCRDCYKKIYRIINDSTNGIHDIDITQSEDKSTMLILIEYNYTIGNLNEIKRSLMLEGYKVDLN